MEKRGLGKGLAALISDSMAEPEGASSVRTLPIAQIAANPMQPRTAFDPAALEELASSLKEHGVLQPILVRRIGHDRYQLIAGERRLRAAQAAGLADIPALVRDCTDKQQLEIAIVENLQREDIGPVEAARAYQRMSVEFGMTQEAIAARVGKSRTAVTNTMGLLDLPEEVLQSLDDGRITEGHARALKGLKHANAILDAWRTVIRRSLSVRDTEKLAKSWREEGNRDRSGAGARMGGDLSSHAEGKREEGRGKREDPNEGYLVGRLQECLKTRVTLKRTVGDAGWIEIEFYSDEDLERIFDALGPVL